ncbi:MAG: hypothetical protein MJ237_05535 [bacterium]|nr:hypothetical protein [bacterium]
MTNNIGRIFGGGSNYNIGGFGRSNKGEEAEQPAVQENVKPNNEDMLVSADKVLEYLSSNMVDVKKPVGTGEYNVAPDVAARIAGYMDHFKVAYDVAKNELGSEEAALIVLDLM